MTREEKIKLLSKDQGRIIHVRLLNFRDFFEEYEEIIPTWETEVEIELTMTGILIGYYDKDCNFIRDFKKYKELENIQIDFIVGELKLQGVI